MLFSLLSIAALSSSVISAPWSPFATKISLSGGNGQGICFNGILGKYCSPAPALVNDQVCFKGQLGNYVCTPIKYDNKQNNFCIVGPLGGYACTAPGSGADPTKLPIWSVGVAITGGNGYGICVSGPGIRICTPYPTLSTKEFCLQFQVGPKWCTTNIRRGRDNNWCVMGPLGGYMCTAPNTANLVRN